MLTNICTQLEKGQQQSLFGLFGKEYENLEQQIALILKDIWPQNT